ncbi:hypothetical protein [Pseudactinotalea sp.]|uniref:hypothetical protein n=1 Tax=Pseudactinotalea sp. TaxID=1926260 RepID=UPI003B3AA48D
MNTLTDLAHRLSEHGWALDRALPRDGEHALLQVRDGAGASVAGQWFADHARAERVAEQTSHGAWGEAVERPLTDVVAQRRGADRRLRGLRDRCAEAGARLRAHRPERRAVVEIRTGEATRYVKVVRPEKLGEAQVRAMTVSLDGVPTPRVLGVDSAAGTVTTAALTGPTVHEAIRMGAVDLGDHLHEVGRVLARLHAADAPADVGRHGPEAEIAVVDRWLGLAEAYGALAAPRSAVRAARARLPELLTHSWAPTALLHRDLHDKQIVLGAAGPGLLDLDLLAMGDPALDLANLVVHLELRARQGLMPLDRATDLGERLLAGYAPDPRTRAAMAGYVLATRLRLVAVYSFRPASAAAAARLVTDPVPR